MIFSKNLKCFLLFLLGKIGLEIVFLLMLWIEGKPFQDYKNVDFTWLLNWFLPKGLVHDFCQKFKFLYCSFISKIGWEKLCGT